MTESRVGLVTGSSRGLGRQIAMALAQDGIRVAVNYLRNTAEAQRTAEMLRAIGQDPLVIRADVGDECAVRQMVDRILEKYGHIDVLVNNAGVSVNNVAWRTDAESWSSVLRTNLTGVFNCTKAAVIHMRESGRGRIVCISSVVGQTGIAGTSAYAASKAGVFGFTRAVAAEVASQGITVNSLALGYFEGGDMLTTIPESVRTSIRAGIPAGRFGTASEVCAAVVFLCSDAAAYITGQTININGGVRM